MVTVTVEAAGLTPGDAHTLWWVVFNNPSACSDPCGEEILFPAGLTGQALLTVSGHEAEVHLVIRSHGHARGGKPCSISSRSSRQVAPRRVRTSISPCTSHNDRKSRV
jgi:hypothetical protein